MTVKQSKMDKQRAELDAQSTFIPNMKPLPNDDKINEVIRGEITKLHSKKIGVDANMSLAKRILDLNPNLPKAFQAKFEVCAIDGKFAECIGGVINDCNKYYEKAGTKLKLKLVAIESNPKKIKKVGD